MRVLLVALMERWWYRGCGCSRADSDIAAAVRGGGE